MLIRLFLMALLVCFSAAANAEYYLVYQAPTAGVINLNFTTKVKKKVHTRCAKYKTKRTVVIRDFFATEHIEKTYACGCTPETCYVPKRDIYTAAPTDCVTYDAVMTGYQ